MTDCWYTFCCALLQAEMAAEADAFICLPGGYGTLEVGAARLPMVASA
jgi:Possible lysine decarboxylase